MIHPDTEGASVSSGVDALVRARDAPPPGTPAQRAIARSGRASALTPNVAPGQAHSAHVVVVMHVFAGRLVVYDLPRHDRHPPRGGADVHSHDLAKEVVNND